MKQKLFLILAVVSFFVFSVGPARAEDSDASRATLAGLQGVAVVVEDLQPSVMKYAAKSGLSKAQVQQDAEKMLRDAGIRIVAGEDWKKTPGKPLLYININTHETEKYWYAYDIKVELRQLATLDANPQLKTLATTWSINITGQANIGTLNVIRKDAGVMVGRFVQAWKANHK
ncbi:MAG: hypothetical protein PHP56_12010 [Smithellaceae bacterium]|mgnify:FL=1|jgi:hypothetical protein|nr:hypothetical protein [Smithellaceae bacterium]